MATTHTHATRTIVRCFARSLPRGVSRPGLSPRQRELWTDHPRLLKAARLISDNLTTHSITMKAGAIVEEWESEYQGRRVLQISIPVQKTHDITAALSDLEQVLTRKFPRADISIAGQAQLGGKYLTLSVEFNDHG
jgi:hypothetical protein